MTEPGDVAPRHPCDTVEAPVVLLVNDDYHFVASVRAEAAALGGRLVLAVAEPGEALTLLLGSTWFSHVILPAAMPAEALCDLVSLTAGEPDSGATAVLIGEGADEARDIPGWRQVMAVPRPTRGWLAAVLDRSSSHRTRSKKLLPLADLLATLDAGRLYCRYQPLVEMASGQPAAFEILARLDHPAFGMVTPDRFVPALEKAGHALRLAEMVAERAFGDVRDGRLDLCGTALGLNLPLDVLQHPCIAERLEAWRSGTGLPAERIAVELTESYPVVDPERLRPVVQRLRAAGYRLSIDDVGAGTHNYEALLSLPFVSVKLDKELVHASATDSEAMALAERIIDRARRHGCRTIAEGVETAADWKRMAGIGVDWAQGFLVARPLTARVAALWYRDWCRRMQPERN